jgi:hypothetical protein
LARGAASPGARFRYTWGDVFLTLVGVGTTLYAADKATQVAKQGGSMLPFWLAYSSGAGGAICWWAYYIRNPDAMQRSQARTARRRVIVIAAGPFLGVVGSLLVQFSPLGLQAVILGAFGGFLLATMLGYAVLVLRQRRRS